MGASRRKLDELGEADGIKLNTLCERLGVSYRDARYALARGIIPKGIENEPGRGNHRVFDWNQAFHLAVVLKLKAAGMSTPLAGLVSEFAARIQGLSVNLGWDYEFVPLRGKFQTEHRWYLDIGDAQFVRHVTNASPSCRAELEELDWVDMHTRRLAKSAEPVVVVRIDLGQIAKLLAGKAPNGTTTTKAAAGPKNVR